MVGLPWRVQIAQRSGTLYGIVWPVLACAAHAPPVHEGPHPEVPPSGAWRSGGSRRLTPNPPAPRLGDPPPLLWSALPGRSSPACATAPSVSPSPAAAATGPPPPPAAPPR